MIEGLRVWVRGFISQIHKTHLTGGGTVSWKEVSGPLRRVLPEEGLVELLTPVAIQLHPRHEAGGRFELSGTPFSCGANGWRVDAPHVVEGLYVSFDRSLSLYFDPTRTLSYRLGAFDLPLKKLAVDRFRLKVMTLVGPRDGFVLVFDDRPLRGLGFTPRLGLLPGEVLGDEVL